MEWQDEALRFATALASGLLLGIERGWTQRGEKRGQRVAGLRTFTLLAIVGGLAGIVADRGIPWFAVGIALSAITLVTIGYGRQLLTERDATTAIAALVTLTIGFVAGMGSPALAIAAAAVVVLVLAMREELHGFLRQLDERDVKALARFAVIALGVLPFLPNRDLGPYDAWNPSHLWWVVVLVTGFSFAGYVANRVFGTGRGTIATALIGGAYSSTAVTQALSQRLGSKERAGSEEAGIVLASAVMYLRVIVLVALLATRMIWPFMVVVAPALLVAWAAGWWFYRQAPSASGPAPPGNPIAIVPALGFLLFVAVAAVLARWAQGQFGEQGLAVLLFLMGAMDVDASIVTAGGLPPEAIAANLAALAIAGTIIANMAVKIGVTLVYARRRGLRPAVALGASTLTLAATIGVLAWYWWGR